MSDTLKVVYISVFIFISYSETFAEDEPVSLKLFKSVLLVGSFS